jgi:hypothetical protein
MTTKRTSMLVLIPLVLGLVGGACGSDGEDATDPTVQATTTSADGPQTTVTTAPPEDRAPELAAVTAEDLGEPWVENQPAGAYQEPNEESCSRSEGPELDALVSDGYYRGAILQRGDATAFVRTNTFEFVDEAAALAFIDLLRTETYQQCRADVMTAEEATAAGAPEGSSWYVREIGDAEGGGDAGFELQLSYQYQATVDGTVQDANGTKDELVMREGALVVVALVELVASEDDPDLTDNTFTEVGAAIQAGLDRVRAS